MTGYFKHSISFWGFFSSLSEVYYTRSSKLGVGAGLEESYVSLCVDIFYASPGDEVNGSVEVVYREGGVTIKADMEILVKPFKTQDQL